MKNIFSSTIAFILGLIIGGLVLLSGGLLGGMIFGVYVMESTRPKKKLPEFRQTMTSPKVSDEKTEKGND